MTEEEHKAFLRLKEILNKLKNKPKPKLVIRVVKDGY